MTENTVFSHLLTEIATQLGVEISVKEGEELTIEFDDAMTGVISHLADRRQIMLKVGLLCLDDLSETQAADLASLLLRMNEMLIPERSMSIAVGSDRRIQVIGLASQDSFNAIQLADAFEATANEGRLIRSFLEKFIAGEPDAKRNHTDKDQPLYHTIKV